MLSFPMSLQPEEAAAELIEMSQAATTAVTTLHDLHDEDIRIGASEKVEVYRQDHIVLYRYRPLVERVHPVPLLICYALVNRPYMIDLQEDRSLVRRLLQAGLDVYLVDWGYTMRNDRWLTLDDYIDSYLADCVDYLCETHMLDAINLIGICQGGMLALCYAALNPEKVRNLITMVAPVDFHVRDGLLNVWMGRSKAETMHPELMVEALGNISGDLMNFSFLMLKPFELGMQKYLQVMDTISDEEKMDTFLRMEKWIFDSPDQAGQAWLQFVTDFYMENGLIKGQIEIGGRRVDLGNITMPVLNIYAEKDHLVPPSSSIALEKYVGTQDYSVKSFPVGHIGMYVSSRVQEQLGPSIVEWLLARM